MGIAPPHQRHQATKRNPPKIRQPYPGALDHAVRLIHTVCCLAGVPSLIDDMRRDLRSEKVLAGIKKGDSAVVFDWLMAALSYQGISDQVAYDYMQAHGRATWRDIEHGIAGDASCPKLASYWHFHDCRYEKSSRTCTQPDHINDCPLPCHDLRNGHLNQLAYSLFLFIRDLVDDDLVGWIDRQLKAANDPPGLDRLARMRASLIDPLSEVYGVSDKVLTMALSSLLIGAPKSMDLWIEVGGSMIAIDTLVHNFLHRSGILHRFKAQHSYGAACYRPGGCAEIIQSAAERIDVRQFNPAFPQCFPRFVQHAIWRYCSQNGLDICNGNHIDDERRCRNVACRMRLMCHRVALWETRRSKRRIAKSKKIVSVISSA